MEYIFKCCLEFFMAYKFHFRISLCENASMVCVLSGKALISFPFLRAPFLVHWENKDFYVDYYSEHQLYNIICIDNFYSNVSHEN